MFWRFALFQSDGGSAQPVSMSFAGARFPLLELAAGPGTLAWRLSGFDQALAGQGARIGAAAVSAPQASVHPENPALRIDLVADPYLA